jgi:hypothetical protein
MPVIPTFDVSVGVPTPPSPAYADPAAFAAPAQALAAGAGQVSNEAAQFAERYVEARRAADASNIVSQGVQQLGDARFRWSRVEDSQAAYAGFQQDAAAIKQKLLANVSDPLVQSYVQRSLDPEIISSALATHDASFRLESSARRGELDNTLLGYRNAIATAPNPQAVAHLNDLAAQAIQGARAGGWIAPEEADQRHIQFGSEVAADQARRYTMANPSAAAAVLGDPAKTQQMFPGLTPNMADALAAHADSRAYRIEARQREAAAIARADLGQTVADLSYAAWHGVSDTPIPEAQIRAAFGAEHGSRIIAGLRADQQAGALFQGVKYASPDQENTLLEWLKQPGALTAGGASWTNGKFVLPPPGTQPPEAPEVSRERARAISTLEGWMDQEHGAAVKELSGQLSGLKERYQEGVTSEPVPEAAIRKLLPSDQADKIVQSMNTIRQGGQALAAIPSATPEQERAAIEAFATPGTLSGNRLRLDQNHQVVPPPAGSVTAPATETPEDQNAREMILAKILQAVQRKHQTLAADPAGYAAAQEDVAPKLQAVDPAKPETLKPAMTALLAMQGHLGIPADEQHVLTNSQVQSIVKDWTTSDPATTNIGAKIDGLREQMGEYFPRAMGDLVTVGKLAPQWQIVASMTEPGQEAGRAELIRALQATAAAGGPAKLAEAVPSDDKKFIDRTIRAEITPFRNTISLPGEPVNVDLLNGVQESIRLLAYTKVMQGASGEVALQKATDDVLNDKYDFGGTLRTPKGLIAQAQNTGALIQRNLTAADIKPPKNADPSLTPEQNAEIVATAARRNGVWVTNRSDDGAILMTPLRDGSMVPVVRRDGSTVGFKWSEVLPPSGGVPIADPSENFQ